MTLRGLVSSLRSQLKAAVDPEFKAGVRKFFREPVDPWGVRSPAVHRIARDIYREIKHWPKAQRDRFMTELWKSGKLEEGAIVCHVYRRFSQKRSATMSSKRSTSGWNATSTTGRIAMASRVGCWPAQSETGRG